MYAKLFASIYQGTLRGNTHGLVVFTNLLAHADQEGWVDIHPRAIAEEVGLSIDEVKKAIEELESPDIESRSPEEDGRRIVKMDVHRAWGWKIVNYGKYRSIRSEEDRREQNRLAQQRFREKHSNKNKQESAPVSNSKPSVSNSKQPSAESAHTEADAEVDTDKPKPIGTSAKKLPQCPVEKVIDLYHQKLPELPKMVVVTPKREDLIKARWKQFEPESVEEGINSFSTYFDFVRGSKFLMGRVDPANGRSRFCADLEWLVNQANFAKVIERKYHETK